ncbi:MAG: phosphatidate cytidylyltransferase [Hyphomicrobium sp.]|jgi:phosphatidate cytidylyltransferase|nr:phosphatidate cytidylyltransferase [Hyphomicrobium sp.]
MTDPAPQVPDPDAMPLISRELQLRIVSGVAVGAIALAVLYWGSVPFAILLAAIAGAMSWEWGRIVRGGDTDIFTVLHIATAVAAALLASFGMAGLAVALIAIGAITVAALAAGSGYAGLTGAGVLYTGLPVIALEWLRSDGALGWLAVLFVLISVVVTDTAAYFTGRGVGGPKLWPAVSPNKTWSGLLGGVTAAALAGALFPYATGSGSPVWMAALGLFLGLIAQGGDLAESALKRHFGRKDASELIPGHGGFMDRMDGVVTASVAAALIALAVEAYNPARALLYGG